MIYRKEFTFDFSSTATVLNELTDMLRGEVVKVVVKVPDFTNDITVTVVIRNGVEMYESATLSDNEEYNITLCRNECILMRHQEECVEATLSGVAGGTGGELTVILYVDTAE